MRFIHAIRRIISFILGLVFGCTGLICLFVGYAKGIDDKEEHKPKPPYGSYRYYSGPTYRHFTDDDDMEADPFDDNN